MRYLLFIVSTLAIFSIAAFSAPKNTNTKNAPAITNALPAAALTPGATSTNDPGPLFMTDLNRETEKRQGNYVWFLIRSLIMVVIFIAVLYFIYLYLKRRSSQMGQNNAVVKTLGMTLVAPNRYVTIIEAGERIFLIGVSESNVSLISEITDKHAMDALRMQASLNPLPNAAAGNIFADVLGDFMATFKVKPLEKKPMEFAKNLRERIRNLGNKDKQ
ncbi:MAG: flagellar biosynthetic protein FliO [Spirochaetes bacterium]|nr:flagellar biosynthetic protein FliO [Spirochaetota bacterium]